MDKNPPVDAGDTGSALVREDPAAAERLSPGATVTTEPMLWSPPAQLRARVLQRPEPAHLGPCSATREATATRSLCKGTSLGVRG